MKTFDRMMSSLMRFKAKLLFPLLAAMLPLAIAACGSSSGVIGSGNGPAYLVVTSPSALPGATFFQMYECFRTTVTATLFFQNGSSGNYTNRVVWSSSSPGTVTVSTSQPGDLIGNQPTPSGGYYPPGTVTPIGGGNATITADYFGIQASIGVQVGTPQSLTVKRIVQGNSVLPPALPASQVQTNGNSLTSTGFKMGVGSSESLTVVAQLNGQEQNVQTTGVEWSFLVPNQGEATINPTTGVITAVSAGAPLIAVVGFDSCIYTATTQVTVASVQSIVEQPEFSGNPALVVGNTEKVNVYACLNATPTAAEAIPASGCPSDETPQDISTQAQLVSSDTGVLSFGVAGITNVASAGAAGGPVNISASFTQGGSQLLTATNLQITTVMATLESFQYTLLPRPPNNRQTPVAPNPNDPTQASDTVPQDCAMMTTTAQFFNANQPTAIVYIGSTVPLQFCILGSYDNGTIQQDITRQMTWTLSDPTLVQINGSTKPQTSGQAFALTTQTSTILVTPVSPNPSVNNQRMIPLTISD
jgi:hypothetical protein